MNNKIIISIEGNIGSGKTTFLNYFKSVFNSEKINFIDEPLDLWIKLKDKNGLNLLELYYNDPEKYAFMFQLYAFYTRSNLLKQALYSDKDIIMTERSTYSDSKIFTKNLYEMGKLSKIQWKIYKSNYFIDISHINYIVYIKTKSEICHRRVIDRKRSEENTIPLEYLKSIEKKHEEWYQNLKSKFIVINNNNHFKKDDSIKILLKKIPILKKILVKKI